MTSLFKVLQNGYKTKPSNFDGYVKDNDLSSDNHQAYYNKDTKK
jgi:hypothetical protein